MEKALSWFHAPAIPGPTCGRGLRNAPKLTQREVEREGEEASVFAQKECLWGGQVNGKAEGLHFCNNKTKPKTLTYTHDLSLKVPMLKINKNKRELCAGLRTGTSGLGEARAAGVAGGQAQPQGGGRLVGFLSRFRLFGHWIISAPSVGGVGFLRAETHLGEALRQMTSCLWAQWSPL